MIGGDCHLVRAALASPCWNAPSNSSLDWTIVGVTLGPDSEVSVMGLGWLSVGDSTRTKAHDICLSLWKSPGGRLMLRMMGSLGLGHKKI